jgi:hypothetical protein
MKHTLIECPKSEAFVNDACPLFAVYTFYSLMHMQFPVLASNKSFIPAKSLSSYDDLTQIALVSYPQSLRTNYSLMLTDPEFFTASAHQARQ